MVDVEEFTEVHEPGAVEWERVTRVSIVCLIEDPDLADGAALVLHRHHGRWTVPTGARAPGEDVWDDSVLRIPLETMGFRRQDTHLFALDDARGHAAFWVTGGQYHGNRPHAADVEWWTGSVSEAAVLLRAQGDERMAVLVEAATESRRTMSYERRAADLHRTLVGAYLSADTPQGGSGFSGSASEWRAARGVLLDAFDSAVSPVRFLDHGCANGLLAVSIVSWAAEVGIEVEAYGVDIAPELVARARSDHPDLASHFFVGDALSWVHPAGERFDVVHVLLDAVPPARHRELIQHQLDRVVRPGGRLVLSEYGDPPSSRSAEAQVARAGFTIAGRTRQPTRAGRPRGFRKSRYSPTFGLGFGLVTQPKRRGLSVQTGFPSVWIEAPQ